jgi:hypothetical protein
VTDAVERRAADQEWKESVDKKMEEGQKTFDRILVELKKNTDETRAISGKLDEHVTEYIKFTTKLNPVVDGMEALSPGIKFFGQVGSALAWIGKWLRRAVIWLSPFAILGGLWHWITHLLDK